MKPTKLYITNAGGYKVPAIRYDQNVMEPGKKYNLIIFLHGLGETGDGTDSGLNRLLTNTNHANILKFGDIRKDFIVLAPQFVLPFNYRYVGDKTEQSWMPDWNGGLYVRDVTLWAIQNLPIDPTRIGLTGLSSGGGGTWDAVIRSKEITDLFAWIAPVCPAPQSGDWTLPVKSNLPVWAFHAKDDDRNPVTATTEPVDLMNKLGILPTAKQTIYPDGKHAIWGRVYGTVELYEWGMDQVNGNDIPVDPEPIKRLHSKIYFPDGESWTIYDNKTYSIERGL